MAVRHDDGSTTTVTTPGLAEVVLHSFPQPIVVLDDEGGVLDWNPQAETLFGWTRDDALGQILVDLVVSDTPGRLLLEQAMRSLRRAHAGWTSLDLTLMARGRHGRRFRVEMTMWRTADPGAPYVAIAGEAGWARTLVGPEADRLNHALRNMVSVVQTYSGVLRSLAESHAEQPQDAFAWNTVADGAEHIESAIDVASQLFKELLGRGDAG